MRASRQSPNILVSFHYFVLAFNRFVFVGCVEQVEENSVPFRNPAVSRKCLGKKKQRKYVYVCVQVTKSSSIFFFNCSSKF